MQGWDGVFQFVVNALNQHYVSPITWTQQSRNQKIKMKVNLLAINPNDPVVKVWLPVSAALASAGLEVLVTKGEVLSTGEIAKTALDWNLKPPSGLFGHRIHRQGTGWGG